MFVYDKLLTPSLMFVSKARAYMSKATFRCSTLGSASGLNLKHCTKLEKCSIQLIGPFKSYEEKKVVNSALVAKCTREMLTVYQNKLACSISLHFMCPFKYRLGKYP